MKGCGDSTCSIKQLRGGAVTNTSEVVGRKGDRGRSGALDFVGLFTRSSSSINRHTHSNLSTIDHNTHRSLSTTDHTHRQAARSTAVLVIYYYWYVFRGAACACVRASIPNTFSLQSYVCITDLPKTQHVIHAMQQHSRHTTRKPDRLHGGRPTRARVKPGTKSVPHRTRRQSRTQALGHILCSGEGTELHSLWEHGHVGVGPLQRVHEREHPLRHRRQQRRFRRVQEDAPLLQYRREQLQDTLWTKRPSRQTKTDSNRDKTRATPEFFKRLVISRSHQNAAGCQLQLQDTNYNKKP